MIQFLDVSRMSETELRWHGVLQIEASEEFILLIL